VRYLLTNGRPAYPIGMMRRGGFDTVIGNPPYLELKSLTEYRPVGYICEKAGNLYALVLERCSRLLNKDKRQGFIVPVSSVSTDRYADLQHLLISRDLWYSSFDDRPSRLFEGLQHVRLTIHLIGHMRVDSCLFSSKYNKWNSTERQSLFSRLELAPAHQAFISNSFPKLTSVLESSIVDKLISQKRCLSFFCQRQGVHKVFYSRKVGYFSQILNFEPRVLDGKGRRRPPSEFKELQFPNKEYAMLALCCLNSNLFYWFITVFSDCRHVNRREVEAFPIDLEGLSKSRLSVQLTKLGDQLMEDLADNSEERRMRFAHDSLTVQCIMPKLSKSIIDKIDHVLSDHYGFSQQELDFIINYDIKYRIGIAGNDNG